MIGLLLYIIVSRPDIMFSVCLYAQFQSVPEESHLTPVKMIFLYHGRKKKYLRILLIPWTLISLMALKEVKLQ